MYPIWMWLQAYAIACAVDSKNRRMEILSRTHNTLTKRRNGVGVEDNKLPSLFSRKHYLDIVDDAWITDTLSDDEIDVPPALDVDPNGSESPRGEPPMWAAEGKVNRWNDLGLDQWVKDTA